MLPFYSKAIVWILLCGRKSSKFWNNWYRDVLWSVSILLHKKTYIILKALVGFVNKS
jgi:hypothetical protein